MKDPALNLYTVFFVSSCSTAGLHSEWRSNVFSHSSLIILLFYNNNMKHIISLTDFSRDDILDIIGLAQELKAKYTAWKKTPYLADKTLIMLFQKTSTRTRLSFETAMTQLWWHAVYLDSHTSNFGLTDFVYEIQATMQFGDFLMMRALHADDVVVAASYNIIPVIDGCSEKYHPCQALGDFLTMIEDIWWLHHLHRIARMWIENNVCNSLKIVSATLWIDMTLLTPEQNPESVDIVLDDNAYTSWYIHKTIDLEQWLAWAQYIHTDTRMDMEFFEQGKILPAYQEAYEKKIKTFMPYQVSASLIDRYASQAKIMHCLPAHIGFEISKDAMDHPNNITLVQAENRLHVQKAILLWLWKKQKACA